MTFLQETEQNLRAMLATSDQEAIVAWVKERILQSYRNGQAKGQPRPAPPHGRPTERKATGRTNETSR